MFKSIFRKKLSMIDMGIVTRHAELGLLKAGKSVRSMTSATDPDGGFAVTIEFD